MSFPRYDKGDWNAICDVCGTQVKASTLRQRWDGFMVCSRDWEPRHPQDFVRGVADIQAPKWTRPEATDTFIGINWTPTIADSTQSYGGVTGSDYIDNTYFLENYLYDGAFDPEFSFIFGKPLADSTTNSSSGVASIDAYIDPTYFADVDIRVVSVSF